MSLIKDSPTCVASSPFFFFSLSKKKVFYFNYLKLIFFVAVLRKISGQLFFGDDLKIHRVRLKKYGGCNVIFPCELRRCIILRESWTGNYQITSVRWIRLTIVCSWERSEPREPSCNKDLFSEGIAVRNRKKDPVLHPGRF